MERSCLRKATGCRGEDGLGVGTRAEVKRLKVMPGRWGWPRRREVCIHNTEVR